MPRLAEKNLCTGCAACYNKCPKNAIEMKADLTGFLFPIVSSQLCVECGACTNACPILTSVKTENRSNDIHAYIMQNLNETVRRESTSGGIFTSIAETIIEKGGVVFGAAYASDFVVKHQYVYSKEKLGIFRNSKYVQSEIGNSYNEVKDFLQRGIWVCFSGTPCQILGLLGFLSSTNKERLVTIDIVCHCVPSPLIYRKYLDYQRKHNGYFDKVVFRDKKLGYSYSTMALYNKQNCIYRNGSESDLWFRAFLHGFCDRDSCSSCIAQIWPRHSDISIWDCFVVREIDKSFDDNKGTTSLIAWTQAGNQIIKECHNVRSKEINPSIFKHKIEREHFSDMIRVNKIEMYKDAHLLDCDAFFNKYLPETMMIKIKRSLRMLLYKSGLYNMVKRFL